MFNKRRNDERDRVVMTNEISQPAAETIVTEPEMGWVAGKLEMETTLPLTAPRISVMACVPRLTTV